MFFSFLLPAPKTPRRNSNESIHPPGSIIARKPETKESDGDANEPGKVAFVLLTWNPDIHAPEAGDDVHGEDNGTEDGELVEAIGRLFGTLRHLAVDLSEVVAMGSGEDPRGCGC